MSWLFCKFNFAVIHLNSHFWANQATSDHQNWRLTELRVQSLQRLAIFENLLLKYHILDITISAKIQPKNLKLVHY